MNLKCVIIDDEPLAIDIIEGHILRTGFLELQAKFTNPVVAFDYLTKALTDILFIDIQMPDLSGLELVRRLDHKPLLIFTTAYDKYALEGFKADAIDYLLKPVDYPEFLKAAEKARKWITANNKNQIIRSDKDFLFIKSEHKIIRIDLKSIRYIKGMSEYVKIYRDNARPVMSLISLKSLEGQLPEDQFMRVHKSYIVNLQKISEVESNKIICGDGTPIPVSTLYKEKFQTYLNKHFTI